MSHPQTETCNMSMTILDALQWAKIQLSAFAATQPDGFVNTALEAQAPCERKWKNENAAHCGNR